MTEPYLLPTSPVQIQTVGDYDPSPKGGRITLPDENVRVLSGSLKQEFAILTIINRSQSTSAVYVGNDASQWLELDPGDSIDMHDVNPSKVAVIVAASGAAQAPAQDANGNYAYVDWYGHGRRLAK